MSTLLPAAMLLLLALTLPHVGSQGLPAPGPAPIAMFMPQATAGAPAAAMAASGNTTHYVVCTSEVTPLSSCSINQTNTTFEVMVGEACCTLYCHGVL